MYRRWQKEAVDKYRTLESFNTFLSRLTPLTGPNVLRACDPADLYSVLSALHSKDRNPELQVNNNPGFYYFLADAVQPPGSEAAGVDMGVPVPTGGEAAASPAAAAAGAPVRREAVIPVSSKCTLLTTDLLAQMFKLEAHPNVSHILLAIVDDDGSASLVRVFNYIQPPFEGPETLPPLDVEGGGVGGESDDD
ncbi:hypothetical protein HYH02_007892 [Chlamydomonas schloesseri]|uniref:tRNA-splicing endonuclease subunit Sen15 domain-containing protein n=1 Tax=Chlamydomonas schloesseri TaxID=2026947 RepID=A0A835WGT5_9CHLO|nr:hypothetical protein HYH02_007892 [Chlamydomonas schloesseri]|eukprot:KAG2447146.1 hypothetical protein HYH02_007892 [Chlamydomonas schloesseri]